ncbi:MAG: hypothetical protein ACD_36C00100G0002 [uncultured bacterium]|uniref:Uncharacterized protein n=1 Tax=Candidatus Gottesmanbacteria bacterium RIFCSPLOWO2_01_FULL_43_11b TaxID=1798392 RepID=A0A1F6AGN2_9BACT|nr:MAG: hypothetical protein ACD_36C00100G0002 [uncultured bacterium]OGG23884.1 MAG: hypothetical protein A3A79_01645 [Candidatus Gottesmanbacteria bacterium RIFCSPLOWO2_01_FULL_43_11b]
MPYTNSEWNRSLHQTFAQQKQEDIRQITLHLKPRLKLGEVFIAKAQAQISENESSAMVEKYTESGDYFTVRVLPIAFFPDGTIDQNRQTFVGIPKKRKT